MRTAAAAVVVLLWAGVLLARSVFQCAEVQAGGRAGGHGQWPQLATGPRTGTARRRRSAV